MRVERITIERRDAERLWEFLEACVMADESTDGGFDIDLSEAAEHARMINDKLYGRTL